MVINAKEKRQLVGCLNIGGYLVSSLAPIKLSPITIRRKFFDTVAIPIDTEIKFFWIPVQEIGSVGREITQGASARQSKQACLLAILFGSDILCPLKSFSLVIVFCTLLPLLNHSK